MGIVFAVFLIVVVSVVIFGYGSRHSGHRNSSHASVYPDSKATRSLGPPRLPLSRYLRKQIYYRANQQCENPFCRSKGRLHIHHIDMNKDNNRLYNLIALCPNCHAGAHSGKYPPTQVHNWMNMDYQRLLARQPTPDSSVYPKR